MPQVEVTIGGRAFEVACQPGEEPYLRSAAQMVSAITTRSSSRPGCCAAQCAIAPSIFRAPLVLAGRPRG